MEMVCRGNERSAGLDFQLIVKGGGEEKSRNRTNELMKTGIVQYDQLLGEPLLDVE